MADEKLIELDRSSANSRLSVASCEIVPAVGRQRIRGRERVVEVEGLEL